jgi:hypothetical protein
MEGSGRWQSDQQSCLIYTSFRWLSYCRLLKLHFHHSSLDFTTVHHTADAVMVPDFLFNTGTLQRKCILTVFVTCFQVFRAVVNRMVISFEIFAACSCWTTTRCRSTKEDGRLIHSRREYQDSYMGCLCWEGICQTITDYLRIFKQYRIQKPREWPLFELLWLQ